MTDEQERMGEELRETEREQGAEERLAAEGTGGGAEAVTAEPPRRTWDFTLMALTIVLLVALGGQSLVGALYSWWAHSAFPNWEQGPGYAAYVEVMNAIAAPLVAGIVVVLGLCVPKRLFERQTLLIVSGGMVAAGLLAGLLTMSLANGLTVYLVAAAALQAVVVVMTFGRVGGLAYLTEGRGRRLGSALLHLGFIVFCIIVVALQDASAVLMLSVSAVAGILLAVGSAMSFYAKR